MPRRTGRTSRIILMVIAKASAIDAENIEGLRGVVFWVKGEHYARHIFDSIVRVMMELMPSPDITANSQERIVTFPNGKTLTVRNIDEPIERQRGIRWIEYELMYDHERI